MAADDLAASGHESTRRRIDKSRTESSRVSRRERLPLTYDFCGSHPRSLSRYSACFTLSHFNVRPPTNGKEFRQGPDSSQGNSPASLRIKEERGFKMMRSAWCVGVTATSLLLMASTALAQSFCSDLDPLVKLAPSGFRSILDDANGGPTERGVTRTLPGASQCWYENEAKAYWCVWDVPSAQVESHVKQLANAIGQCYHVRADYQTTPAGDGVVAFVDLPNAISVYINGVGGMVALSVGGRHFDERSGRSTEGGHPGDQALAGPPPEVLAPDYVAPPPLLAPLPAQQPVTEARPYSPEAGREVGGVRTPWDGPPVGPLRARH